MPPMQGMNGPQGFPMKVSPFGRMPHEPREECEECEEREENEEND